MRQRVVYIIIGLIACLLMTCQPILAADLVGVSQVAPPSVVGVSTTPAIAVIPVNQVQSGSTPVIESSGFTEVAGTKQLASNPYIEEITDPKQLAILGALSSSETTNKNAEISFVKKGGSWHYYFNKNANLKKGQSAYRYFRALNRHCEYARATSPLNANFNLYVYKKVGSTWDLIKQSVNKTTATNRCDNITFNTTAYSYYKIKMNRLYDDGPYKAIGNLKGWYWA